MFFGVFLNLMIRQGLRSKTGTSKDSLGFASTISERVQFDEGGKFRNSPGKNLPKPFRILDGFGVNSGSLCWNVNLCWNGLAGFQLEGLRSCEFSTFIKLPKLFRPQTLF